MKCDECGTLNSEDDLFCGTCGAVLAAPLFDGQVDLETSEVPEVSAPSPTPSSPQGVASAARDSRANAAFVMGIVSIGLALVSCIPLVSIISCIGPLVGIVAIVLGIVTKRDIEARGGKEEDHKKAHQGMIMGIVGIVLYVGAMLVGFVVGLGFSVLGEM